MIKPNYLEELVLKKLEMLQLMKIATDQKDFKFHLENLKKMKLWLPHLEETKNSFETWWLLIETSYYNYNF